jgi:peptide/nickel transport system ATP-binding protein
MHRGQIVERGPPSQIFLDPKSAYTRELVAAIPGEQPRGARALAGVNEYRRDTAKNEERS